jgi:hypothetical protein
MSRQQKYETKLQSWSHRDFSCPKKEKILLKKAINNAKLPILIFTRVIGYF